MVAIFLMQVLAGGLIVGVVAIVHDLIFDWVEVKSFSIDSAPHELAGNDRTWRVTVKMNLKDTSWFWGSLFGPRRIIGWRVLVEPDADAVSNGWVQPLNFTKQGGRTTYVYVHEVFVHDWEPPVGEHGSTVKAFINGKGRVNQRVTFRRLGT